MLETYDLDRIDELLYSILDKPERGDFLFIRDNNGEHSIGFELGIYTETIEWDDTVWVGLTHQPKLYGKFCNNLLAPYGVYKMRYDGYDWQFTSLLTTYDEEVFTDYEEGIRRRRLFANVKLKIVD